jgi:hypothetical protein
MRRPYNSMAKYGTDRKFTRCARKTKLNNHERPPSRSKHTNQLAISNDASTLQMSRGHRNMSRLPGQMVDAVQHVVNRGKVYRRNGRYEVTWIAYNMACLHTSKGPLSSSTISSDLYRIFFSCFAKSHFIGKLLRIDSSR